MPVWSGTGMPISMVCGCGASLHACLVVCELVQQIALLSLTNIYTEQLHQSQVVGAYSMFGHVLLCIGAKGYEKPMCSYLLKLFCIDMNNSALESFPNNSFESHKI